uniref:Cytochrome c oxidase subunit 2 n=1 Tax=Rhinebothrium scobinae TaxID=3079055 RepID=A0A8K1W711_9CEST|nr:cytochrome c oxidase subunit II [Rhinebothrium scobinae]UFQ88756.1 cytochrome c oxidase subunit II [Rhinebothrium scobinae]
MNVSIVYYDIVCYVIAVCIFILCFVYFLLYWNSFSAGSINFGADNQFIELTWTIIPTLVVLVLCVLNVNFITSGLDCLSSITIKIVGHQWYWSYDYPEGSYDSFVCKDGFQVDKPLRLSYGVPYHLIVTSADVIHSFSVPALNLKMDAIPGRLNHLYFCPSYFGVFTGYCAELCGAGHSYMPIVMEVVK